MIKKITIIILMLLTMVSSVFAQPTFGGNMPALRPGYTAADEVQFDLALSYLKPGSVARIQTIFWEVNWDKTQPSNYRGIDLAIYKMAKKGVTPLFLLMPTPYPSSPWYNPPHNDWWLPKRDVWTDAIRLNTEMATHIQREWKKAVALNATATTAITEIQVINTSVTTALPVTKTGTVTISQISSITSGPITNVPFFQIWNEPAKNKPGGSITSLYGEWTDTLHEFLFLITTDLTKNGITKAQLISPSISCIGEGFYASSSELLSAKPPKAFDWLSLCGYRAYHLRFGASWAAGNVIEIRRAFQFNMDNLMWIDSKMGFPVGQKLIMTEWYVTPADCGVAIGADMYQFHVQAFEVLKKSKFSHTVVWGLRPGETDGLGNPWLTYGGVGDSLVRWQAVVVPPTTSPTTSPTTDVKSGGG